ncbi:unnamed protein product [Caenorhabditis angaria]|uniref:Uncharacterized protein n=1 Tax=Caenorhabditis angaria TaxID=860376 RepID=A0A9P1ICE5_9PELO|nr:unnamed protein product [Caenorhabditis angaria]
MIKPQFHQFVSSKPVQARTSLKSEEPSVYSIVYKSINKFLSHSSENPQRLCISIGQESTNRDVFSITFDELTKENALTLADSRHFAAAFDAADNRKAVKKSCAQARNFYKEHIVTKNPFPPRQKIPITSREVGKLGKQWRDVEHAKKSNSEISLKSVCSTLSLTSLPTTTSSRTSVLKSSNKVPTKRSKRVTKKERPKVPDSMYLHLNSNPTKIEKKKNSISKEEERRLQNIFSNHT